MTSLELSRKEGIMISKPINLINAKLEEMYDSAMFWFYTTFQAIVFDANQLLISNFSANAADKSSAP